MKRILLFQFILIMLSGTLTAQDIAVSGRVTDPSGNALPGVSVFLKGTSTGTMTNADGRYALEASAGTIVFTFIGYKTTEVSIDGKTVIDIQLEEDVTALGEVVVIGYGTQQKKDITGAVSVIDKEAMASRPNTQFGNLIQGKTAGVQVLSSSGKPSAGFSIRIRGSSSISGSNEPLYVVDGVVVSDTRTLNPADIETFSILKDASSAAIYGAQGANGVVLITTKQGSSSAPKIEFNAYAGFSSAWKQLKVLNSEQFRDLMTEMGQTTDWSLYTENTDWQDKVFQNGRSQNYQLAVSGKNDKTSYYISGGWVEQIGAVRSAEMSRYNAKVSLTQQTNDWLSFGTNVNYAQYHDVDVSDNTNVNSGGVILGMISTPPNIGVYNSDGTFTRNPFQDWENPISGTDGADRGYKNHRILGNIYSEAYLMPDLKFKTNFGIDNTFALYDYFLDPFKTGYGRVKKGIARSSTDFNSYYIFDNTLSYQKNFAEHNFTALAGFVVQKYKWEANSLETNGFASDAIPTANAGAVLVAATNSKAEKSNASFISRLTYDYKGTYLLTANFRADASSAFGPNKRWGYFPSASLGWRISNESFFSDVPYINDLKLRVGWGLVGNDMGAYAYIGKVGVGANYPIDGVINPGNFPSTIQNNDLQWESTQQTNLGIDVSLLESRITFTFDAYVKNTSNLLLYVPIPRSTGFDNGLQNYGKVQNRGLEFQVSSQNLQGALQWQTDFNISFNRNEIIDIVNPIFDAKIGSRDEITLSQEGKPLSLFYGYVAGSVDPATGNLYYIDQNGESTFTPSSSTDKRFIGDPNPDFIYGLTNTLTYKNFSLNLFLQGSQGNDVFNMTKLEGESMTDPKNQLHSVTDRWRQPGDQTNIPKASPNDQSNARISSRFVEDGSYLRVKALTLGFNFPSALLSKAKISAAKIYVTGENLLTLTGYSGFDPEVNAYGGSPTVQGVDYGTYPQTRNIIFGVNLTF